ncbi:hypothetical protein RJ641_026292 [Dillenia turbinata]|uniref:Uncharacterized protein n=1 Tax=Dillenia turbinata TaxID=194707 RepID=A0AAN8W4H8_9MAGN
MYEEKCVDFECISVQCDAINNLILMLSLRESQERIDTGRRTLRLDIRLSTRFNLHGELRAEKSLTGLYQTNLVLRLRRSPCPIGQKKDLQLWEERGGRIRVLFVCVWLRRKKVGLGLPLTNSSRSEGRKEVISVEDCADSLLSTALDQSQRILHIDSLPAQSISAERENLQKSSWSLIEEKKVLTAKQIMAMPWSMTIWMARMVLIALSGWVSSCLSLADDFASSIRFGDISPFHVG